MMSWSGKQVEQLHRALMSAFPTVSTLRMMIRIGLGENLEVIAGGTSLSDTVFQMLMWAESQGRLEELVKVAYDENPGNPELRHFVEQFLPHVLEKERNNSTVNSVIQDESNDRVLRQRQFVPLTGEKFKQLHQALLSSYPTFDALSRMVRIGLYERLEDIAEGSNLVEVAYRLIVWAETEDRLEDLVEAATRQNPANLDLNRFVEQFSRLSSTYEDERSHTVDLLLPAYNNRDASQPGKIVTSDETTGAQVSGLLLLHLSDLHFGNKNRFQGRDLAAFGQQFSQAVRDACEERGWKQPVELVVVSGDIAEVAKPKEFTEGRVFLTSMSAGLGVPSHRVLFVPGNHDVSWTQCKRVDLDREDGLLDAAEYPKRLHSAKFQYYHQFLQSFYGLTDANLLQLPGRTLLDAETGAYLHDFILEGTPISFAALNTSEKETDKIHGGELGKAQAEALIKAWMGPEYARYLKVAVVHHNPLATPPENLHWTEEWFQKQIAEQKLEVTPEWLAHYTADMAGFKGAEYLQRIVKDTGAHIVLHGHHHNPTGSVLWGRKEGGVAPILSVGSFGLNANQIPTDQPLTCQLIMFQIEPEPKLIAIPLEYDPNYRPTGILDKGQFRLNLKSESMYEDGLPLPKEWITKSHPKSDRPADAVSVGSAPELLQFTTYYRNHLVALHSSYDLKNLGVLPAEMHKTQNPQLDDLYLPLRFDTNFDINRTDAGVVLDVDALLNRLTTTDTTRLSDNKETHAQRAMLVRSQSLAITGAAGAGKTTWTRYTFRRMLQDARTLPFLVELRAVAKFWNERKNARNKWSIEAFLEYWLEENAPAYRDIGAKLQDVFKATESWFPVLMVDGWDELGDMGIIFREKLLGLMQQYPRLLVIASSRPYGSARPRHTDGFEQLQVQPLSSQEIATFTLNFYQKCYQEEETLARSQADVFGKALAHSEDAALLAKTPLLLTMMLFINRSKRLPDKRQQLYAECLMSLLHERPDMQKDQGARLLEGQWYPEESGSAILQTVAQMAYELQTNHVTKQISSGTAGAILVSKETLKQYLPKAWDVRQKDGFLLWLCGRAGVMVDDAQDNIRFAHLSFQEFLTAWHLNNNRVGQEALVAFSDLAVQPLWWETLLLWAALLNDQSTKRAEELLQTLLEKGSLLLAGMMLADGVGATIQLRQWIDSFAALLCRIWPQQVERCLRAWQASRQEERRNDLGKTLIGVGEEAHWLAWLRIKQAMEGLGSREELFVKYPKSSRQVPLIALTQSQSVSVKQFVGEQMLSGLDLRWPGNPAALLHLWPSERRLVSLDLQCRSSLGADRPELLSALERFKEVRHGLSVEPDYIFFLIIASASSSAGVVAHHLISVSNQDRARVLTRARDFALDYDFTLVVNSNDKDQALAQALDSTHDVILALTLANDIAIDHAYDPDFAMGFNQTEVIDRARDLANNLAQVLHHDLDRACDFANDLARILAQARDQVRDSAQALADARDQVRDLVLDRSLANALFQNLRYDADLSLGLDRAHQTILSLTRDTGRIQRLMNLQGTPLLHSTLCCLKTLDLKEVDKKHWPLGLLIPAAQVSVTKGRVGTDELNAAINFAQEQGMDDFWSAYARHIAGVSTKKDRDLLEDLAVHPEKREGTLSWGLQHTVRGDILLPDETVVTLDQLCAEAGLPLYPLLENMPSGTN